VTTVEILRLEANASARATDTYAELLRDIGRADVVLIGEASHGTHEFYHERAQITKRLISEYGFRAVAVEADWPDALRVNRFVFGEGADRDAEQALGGFLRFPTWMWRNADVLDFVGWLRDRNDRLPKERAGFYGLDLYSLRASIDAVIAYLDRVDPPAAERARRGYACFDLAGEPADYGYAVELGLQPSCRDEVTRELLELRLRAADYVHLDGAVAADEYFYATLNAGVAQHAEEYYRTMLDPGVSSWNLRDRHMFETLERLASHLERNGGPGKIVVWAHNSHVGDAGVTDMGRRGEINIGSLTRARYGARSRRIGFTTYGGTVSAATDWGAPVERKAVRPALSGSYEELFHRIGVPRFLLRFNDNAIRAACHGPLLERAIGVIYRPETERQSHYFHADLAEQFDAIIHIDHTRAIEPLERTPKWTTGEVAETFPTGI
jgi:erythromycin esterase-like protein